MPAWDTIIPAEDLVAMQKEWGMSRGFGAQPALIVVDMTYAFVDDRFPTGYGKTGWPCVAAIRQLLDLCRSLQLPIFYSSGLPVRNPAERGLWKSSGRQLPPGLPDPHSIVPDLEPLPTETVIRKRRPSAFFGTELASLLTFHRVDTVIVTGMVTSGCVRATVVDAFSHNLRVIVPEECVADRAQIPHAVNLFDIQMKYGDAMSLAEVIAALEARQPARQRGPRLP